MKRQIIFGTMLSAALTVGVSAQSGGQAYPGSDQESSKSSKSAQTVTLTGCLESGSTAAGSDTSAMGQSGTSKATDRDFVLTNASPAGGSTGTSGTGAPGSTAGGAATGGAGSSSATASTYKLSGSTGELKKLVNHKVEVTGRVEHADGSSSMGGTGSTSGTGGTGGSATSGSKSGSAGMKSDMPRLRVTSVKDVAGSCSGGGL